MHQIEYIPYAAQVATRYNQRVKITVLDTSPALDDLDFGALMRLGVLEVHNATQPEALAERLEDAEILVLNKVRLDAATLAVAPKLKLVTVLATGYDVDRHRCGSRCRSDGLQRGRLLDGLNGPARHRATLWS